jgi:long-chain acyl-CoA synthetase
MRTLIDLPRWAATQYGGQPALSHDPGTGPQTWTYSEFWEQIGRVAAHLQAQGIGPGDRVVIWAPNSAWWVAAYFAVMRLRAILVPLDTRSAPDFIARAVGQTTPKLALLAESTRPGWTFPIPVVRLDKFDRLPPGHVDGPEPEPDDTAQLIFTSGTTGDPKGVILTHGNILANAQGVNTFVPDKPHYTIISVLPLSHMLEQTMGLLVPIQRGALIYYVGTLQPATLLKAMQEQAPDTMLLVPQVLHLFMNQIEREAAKQGRQATWERMQRLAPYLPRPVRRLLFRSVLARLGGRLDFLMSGGAPLPAELIRKWEALGVPVLQGYGTTEASPAITVVGMQDRDPRWVGTAVPGVQIRIADDGEILVRGPNVTPGYWQNPAATEAAFADGWYKTGDLGQLDEHGHLILHGRKKDMIVLPSGQNVYPEDIETVLCSLPGVLDAAVVGLPTATGQEVHAVLLCDTPERDPAPIIYAANARLAPHQRIRSWTVWPEDDLPRTHTLKVKKHEVLKALAARKAAPDLVGAAR